MNRFITVMAAVTFAVAAQAAAQPAPSPAMAMPGMHAAPTPTGDNSMMAAMEKMSRDMAAVPMSGDADRDFAAMMIPHHQGAIDMANYELAHGKDPAMRKLARDIVSAQKREIALMKASLAKHTAH